MRRQQHNLKTQKCLIRDSGLSRFARYRTISSFPDIVAKLEIDDFSKELVILHAHQCNVSAQRMSTEKNQEALGCLAARRQHAFASASALRSLQSRSPAIETGHGNAVGGTPAAPLSPPLRSAPLHPPTPSSTAATGTARSAAHLIPCPLLLDDKERR